jgi:CO dehydrogenase maturation factor
MQTGGNMKLVICGKGGSGKSTVASLLSRTLANKGYNVILIDADESNSGLHRMMGIDAPRIMMDDLGGKKGFREKTQGSSFPGGKKEIFRETLSLDDLAPGCDGNPRLLSIGKIHEPGEGCACPMGSLSRMILSRLALGERDMVIIDTSAGIEHFGRGIDSHCDAVLGVIDPSYESFALAEKMQAMAEKAGLEIHFVLNKSNPEMKEILCETMSMDSIAGEIESREDIFKAGMRGTALPIPDPGIEKTSDLIIALKRRTMVAGGSSPKPKGLTL